MIHEYAVDPNSLSSFNEIWQALEQFGVENGRLVVECPKRWWAIVKQNLEQAQETLPAEEFKVLEDRCHNLRHSGKLTRRRGLQFDGQQASWIRGLATEHSTRPFRAAIQLNTEDRSVDIPVLSRFDLHDGNPLWQVERSVYVSRDEHELAVAAIPLLAISTDMLFIDPYFSAEPRHCIGLSAMLNGAIKGGAKPQRLEVHTKTTAATPHLSEQIHLLVVAKVRDCPAITVVRWTQREGGERLHDRFILTDRGGLEIPGGTDGSRKTVGESTNVHLLNQRTYEFRWQQYQLETSAFELAEKFTVL